MADMITRCPKCSTAFRLSEELIASSKGVVRCGSCLNVFNATEYLVTNAKKKQPVTASSASRPMSQVLSDLEQLAKTTESAHKSATSNTPLASSADSKLKKPQFVKQPQKLKKPSSESSSLFERTGELADDDENEDSVVDEAWALELLKDDSDTDSADVQIRKVIDHKSVSATQKPPAVAKPSEQKTSATKQPEHSGNDEATYFRREELHSHASIARPKTPPAETTRAPNTPNTEKVKLKSSSAPASDVLHNTTSQPEKLISSIADIEPESLDSILMERKPSMLRRIVWASLTATALILCIGQILWLQFYRLNQQQPYRTIYSVACIAFDCKLPELKNLTLVHASNLVIRSHPEKANALAVDVIIKNSAPFEQRFPSLRLTFTDLQNNPVASRKFPPKEYLGGELAGQTMMPTDQPIHIGMDIVDPGPKAVSYNIAIEN